MHCLNEDFSNRQIGQHLFVSHRFDPKYHHRRTSDNSGESSGGDDVTGLNEDVIGLRVDHTQLEGDVNFLFDEQVIQDERLLGLEQTSVEVIVELAEISVKIQGWYLHGHMFTFCLIGLRTI